MEVIPTTQANHELYTSSGPATNVMIVGEPEKPMFVAPYSLEDRAVVFWNPGPVGELSSHDRVRATRFFARAALLMATALQKTPLVVGSFELEGAEDLRMPTGMSLWVLQEPQSKQAQGPAEPPKKKRRRRRKKGKRRAEDEDADNSAGSKPNRQGPSGAAD